MVFIAYIGQTHYKSHLGSQPQAARPWPYVNTALLFMYCTWCLLFMVHASLNHRLKFSFQMSTSVQTTIFGHNGLGVRECKKAYVPYFSVYYPCYNVFCYFAFVH